MDYKIRLPLNEITESIDLKITLKYKLGDIDKIQYIELTKKQDAELFLAITEAVSISMSKTFE